MDLGLRGKTAIVAAASQGLGRGVATALAAEGANVVMFSRTDTAIQAAATADSAEVNAGRRLGRSTTTAAWRPFRKPATRWICAGA